MEFMDDWGLTGSDSSKSEVEQPTVIRTTEGASASVAPQSPQQLPSQFQLIAPGSSVVGNVAPG